MKLQLWIMGCFSDVFVVVFRVKLGESALQAAKETQATAYVTDYYSKLLLHTIYLWSVF